MPSAQPTDEPTVVGWNVYSQSYSFSFSGQLTNATQIPTNDLTLILLPIPSLFPTATTSPTSNSALTPSPKPTSGSSLLPVHLMTLLPTTNPSFDPSLAPSSVPTQPSPEPSLEPSPVPSLHPTRSPTLQPTTTDTISVAVSLAMTATAEPTSEAKKSLKGAIASSLDIDEGYLKDFTVVSEATARRWVRRALLASYTWSVAFTVKAPLSETTFDSSSSYSENMESALTSDSFVSSVLSTVGATVDVTSISSEVTTTRNTPQPTVSVVAIGDGGEVDAEGSSGNNESSSDAIAVFVLLGVLVFAGIAAGLFFRRRRLVAKRDDESITNKSDTGVKLAGVQVETPKASLTFGDSMQSPKPGCIVKFLQEKAKIPSARVLFVADKFAEHGYESASDFERMTVLELSDEHLRDKIGLALIDIRKFKAALSRAPGQASTAGLVGGAASIGTVESSEMPLKSITLVPPQDDQMRSRNFSVIL